MNDPDKVESEEEISKEWDRLLDTPESHEFLTVSGEQALADFKAGKFQTLQEFADEIFGADDLDNPE